MNTAPKYSEREMVVAQHDAYMRGAVDRSRYLMGCRRDDQPDKEMLVTPFFCDGKKTYQGQPIEEAVIGVYPFPKITQPREVADTEHSAAKWRVVDDTLHVYVAVDWCIPDGSWGLTPKRVALWNDLFANPTEEVEDRP